MSAYGFSERFTVTHECPLLGGVTQAAKEPLRW
jgi:hypothetical protein